MRQMSNSSGLLHTYSRDLWVGNNVNWALLKVPDNCDRINLLHIRGHPRRTSKCDCSLDIHLEVFRTEGIQTKPMTDTIAFVKTRETACNANPASAVSAFSEYQRSNQDCLNNGFRVMLNHQPRLTSQRLLHVPIVTLPSIFIPRRDVDKTNDPHTLRKFLEEEASLDQANWCDRVDFPILMMASLVRLLPSTSQHHHLNWCLARLQYKPWVMISSVRDNRKGLRSLHSLKSPSILP